MELKKKKTSFDTDFQVASEIVIMYNKQKWFVFIFLKIVRSSEAAVSNQFLMGSRYMLCILQRLDVLTEMLGLQMIFYQIFLPRSIVAMVTIKPWLFSAVILLMHIKYFLGCINFTT